MPRSQKVITLTPELVAAIATYQKRVGLRSWNAALFELANKGLASEGLPGFAIPRPGGWQGNPESLDNLARSSKRNGKNSHKSNPENT